MPWTESDKQRLIIALQKYGTDDVKIAEVLPCKSITEIRQVISSYQKTITNIIRKERSMLKIDDAPIDKWLKFLIQISSQPESVQYISKAVKYISLYEKRNQTVGINLM